MKGLLIKDLLLMKTQVRFFLVIVVLSLWMAFSLESSATVGGYLVIVMPMFAISTISYDEFDNGNAFLFTLPITRRLYVLEKYCFGALLGGAAMVLALPLSLGLDLVRGVPFSAEVLLTAPIMMVFMVIVLSIMLPLQLKFGAEKSRIAIIILGIGVALLGFGGAKLLAGVGIDAEALLNTLLTDHLGLLLVAAIALALLIPTVSVLISLRIMNKKEL